MSQRHHKRTEMTELEQWRKWFPIQLDLLTFMNGEEHERTLSLN